MSSIRDASLRWMYSGGRPNRVAALLNRAGATVASAGFGAKRLVTLEVRGRHSGRTVSLPVVVADYGGERYLVSMLGADVNWVRNVDAAGGRAVLRHGRREPVRLEAVDPSARAGVLRRYLELAPGARAHFPISRHCPLAEFEPIAAQYPVFRVIPDQASPN
jgi:hypothetical protein